MPSDDLRERIEYERTRHLAEAAVGMLGVFDLRLSAENIALFHAYALRREPALVREIDGRLERGLPITQALCDELHARFVEPRAEPPAAGPRRAAARPGRDEAPGRAGAPAVNRDLTLRDHLHVAVSAASDALVALAGDARGANERIRGVEARLGDAIAELQGFVQRLERAERFAATDSLTELPNRRSFEERLRRLVQTAEASGRPLSLLLFDVDHFKAFNDAHGHAVGDHVLRLVAKGVAAYPRGDELAARYGGEEFALLLPGLRRGDAVRVAETMRQALAERRLTMRGSGRLIGNVTVSVGVAERRAREGAAGLVRRADMALYRAKESGRNRVVATNDDQPPIRR